MNGFWGDLPTWITTLAIAFGAIQLKRSRLASQKEDEREARAQASGVWAWAGSYRGAGDADGKAYGFVIVNNSLAPIHNVRVSLQLHGEALNSELIQQLPPGEYFVEWSGKSWKFPLTSEEFGKPIRPYSQTQRYLVKSTEFEDAVGVRWQYSAGHGLTRVKTPARSGHR